MHLSNYIANLKMIHILCIHHFQQDVFAVTGGMGDMSNAFKIDSLALMYRIFHSEKNFEDEVEQLLILPALKKKATRKRSSGVSISINL